MVLHNEQEKLPHQVIQQSIEQHQSKEPTVAETMEILSRNYSEKDPDSLRNLCVKFEGRSSELEKYIEANFNDIPTKLEAEQGKVRA